MTENLFRLCRLAGIICEHQQQPMEQSRAMLIDLLESIASRDFNIAREIVDRLEELVRDGGVMPEAIHKAMDALRFSD